MEMRHLRYFVAVAEHLHFGKAAAELRIAQPSLSHQIRQLETELQTELLHRTKRRVQLTEAGRLFLEQAREILAHTDRAALIARRAVQGTAGRLRIGLAYWMDVTNLIEVVKRLERRQPGIQLEMRQMSATRQLTAIGEERLDIGFVHPPIPKQLNGEIVASEPFVAALPFHHRLSMTPSIPLAALSHEPFILFPRESMRHLYDRAIEVCGEVGFTPNVREEIDQPDLMLRLVAAGLGISLVPSSARKAPRPGVALRMLEPSRRVLDTAVAWPKHASPPVLGLFLEVVREVFNAASGLSRRGSV
jgi:DNA-binding transcriptional LysR family regulator